MSALTLTIAAISFSLPQQGQPVAELALWQSSPAAPAAPDASVYLYDDGTPEQAIGYTGGGDMLWLQYFDPIGGADVLTQIASMNGRSGSLNGVAIGTVGGVAVWDDPNDDGFPHDCVLLNQSPWTVQFKNQNMFEPIAITPTLVSSRFFIGAWLPHLAGNFPAPLDNNMPSMGRSWLNNAAAGTFNPNNISGGTGLIEIGTGTTFNGVLCLRAEGLGNPGTAFCTAKSGLACGTPSILALGTPSATSGSGFVVSAGPARSCRSGILMYNTSALGTGVPFQGGTLCVNPGSIRRAGPTNSEGTPGGANCDGEFALDMNAFAAGAWIVPDCAGMPSGLAPNNPAAFLQNAGQDVFCQYWGRDSVATGSFLSSGIKYTIQP